MPDEKALAPIAVVAALLCACEKSSPSPMSSIFPAAEGRWGSRYEVLASDEECGLPTDAIVRETDAILREEEYSDGGYRFELVTTFGFDLDEELPATLTFTCFYMPITDYFGFECEQVGNGAYIPDQNSDISMYYSHIVRGYFCKFAEMGAWSGFLTTWEANLEKVCTQDGCEAVSQSDLGWACAVEATFEAIWSECEGDDMDCTYVLNPSYFRYPVGSGMCER